MCCDEASVDGIVVSASGECAVSVDGVVMSVNGAVSVDGVVVSVSRECCDECE